MPSSELFNKAVSKVEQVIDSPSTTESLYKKYEALPLTQQLALSMTPGIGETISAYETPKFAGEAKESFDKGEYLEATGKTAMAGLSALGAIPFLGTGVRAVKGGIKAATKMDEIGEGLSSILKSEKELKKYGDTWKNNNRLPSNQRQAQDPIVKQAAQDLDSGKIKGKQFRDTVKEVLPIKPIDEMMDIPTFEEIAGALKKDQVKKGIVGVNKNIPDGTKVATRLDIPAYNNYDKWIVSIHEGIKGPSTGYSKSARLKNVNFGSSTKGALRVSKGADKATFARMEGNWTNTPDEDTISFAERLLKNEKNGKYIDDAGEEWVQVGMNPYRGSYFYDKATGQALQAADELIQVGPLVFAKGSRKPTLSEYKKGFTTTTEAGNKVAFAGGGQVSDGLDNLYMNRRDSKQKLDGMIGIQSRQYGGGLDDAYMNRRRSSAFADPNATNAFADPNNPSAFIPDRFPVSSNKAGGLPTIYREDGGTTIPKERMINDQPHQLSYINPEEAGLLQALGGSGRMVDGVPSYFWSDDTGDGGYTDDGDDGVNDAAAYSNAGGNDDGTYNLGQLEALDRAYDPSPEPEDIANLLGGDLPSIRAAMDAGIAKDAEDRSSGYLSPDTTYRTSGRGGNVSEIRAGWNKFGTPEIAQKYIDNLKGKYGQDQATTMVAAALASPGGVQALGSGTGTGDTITDLINAIGESDDLGRQRQRSYEGIKEKERSLTDTLKSLLPVGVKVDPRIEKANKEYAKRQGGTYTPEGFFSKAARGLAGVVVPGVGMLQTGLALAGKSPAGTFNIDGLDFNVAEDGTSSFNNQSMFDTYDEGGSGNDKEIIPKEKKILIKKILEDESIMKDFIDTAKKDRVDPNIQIIMDIYGYTFDEAEEFLGKKTGIGTGGVGEFEGI